MSEAMSVAPLSHQAPIVAGEESLIAMTEIVGRRMIDLRVRPEDKSAFDAVRTVLGFDLPGTPR